jgi:adenosylcobinamide-phosphate synthase
MLLPLLGLGDLSAAVGSLVLLLAALCLDAVVGGSPLLWRALPHPVRVIGGLVGWLDRKLNREHRSPADRRRRGALTVIVVVASCAAVGAVVTAARLAGPLAWLAELVVVTSLLAQRSLYDHVRAVAVALAVGGTPAGREAVAHIVGRDVTVLDEHGVARAAIESCAENFSDAVVAPVLWYALFGVPGMLVYKAVNTMDSMIGHRTPRHRAFGAAAARLDDVLNLIPARLAAVLLTAAAVFVPGATAAGAARVTWRDARKHRSPNAGWPESAAAGALGLALAGPRRYNGVGVDGQWLGDGRARATGRDIHRVLVLFVVACALLALMVAAAALATVTVGGAAPPTLSL